MTTSMTTATSVVRGSESLAALCALWQAEGREAWITLNGGSMSPTILPGTRIRLHCHRRPPVVGEIVVYRQGGSLVIHRLVEITSPPDILHLICLGDGNVFPDAPIPAEAVVGTVTAVSSMPFLKRALFALCHPRRHTRYWLRLIKKPWLRRQL